MTAVSTSPSDGTAALAMMIGHAWRAMEPRVGAGMGTTVIVDASTSFGGTCPRPGTCYLPTSAPDTPATARNRQETRPSYPSALVGDPWTFGRQPPIEPRSPIPETRHHSDPGKTHAQTPPQRTRPAT